jgi:hypothetical protein
MGRKLAHLLRRHLFLLVGLFSLGLFFLVAGLDRAGQSGAAAKLAPVMRVAIVPIYIVWLLLTIVVVKIFGPGGPPMMFSPTIMLVEFIAGLAPYVLLDYLINRRRPR